MKTHTVPGGEHPVHYLTATLKKEGFYTGGGLIILPTQRNLKSAALAAKEGSPDLITISDFIKFATLRGRAVVPPELRMNYLHRAALSLSREDKMLLLKSEEPEMLEDFLSFAESGGDIFRFFSEITAEGIDFETLAAETVYTDYEKHALILRHLYELYEKELNHAGFTDTCFTNRTPELNEAFVSRYKKCAMLISGFLTVYELEMLKKLSEMLELHLFFRFYGEKHKNLIRAQDYLGITIDDAPAGLSGDIGIYEAKSQAAQYERIISSVYETQAGSKDIDFQDIVVILPDEQTKHSFLSNDEYNLFNVSSGRQASAHGAYETLLTIIEAQDNSTQKKLRAQDVFKISKSPVFESADSDNHLLKGVLSEIESGKKLLIDIDFIFQKLPTCKKFLTPLTADRESITLQDACLITAEFFKNTAAYLSDADRENLPEIMSELTRLRKLYSLTDDTFSPAKAFRTVLDKLSRLSFHVSGGPVRVIGLLESRNMKYKCVIVPDMNESFFPPKSGKDLFLNTEIRGRLNLPDFADRQALAENYLRQILQNADKSILIYIRSDESPRSSFIEKLLLEIPQNENNPQPKKPDFHPEILYGDQSFKEFAPAESFANSPELISRLRQNSLSPSSINTFLTCKYKFYMKHVKKVEAPVEISGTIAPIYQGKLIHDVLEQAYKNEQYKDPDTFAQELKKSYLYKIAEFDAYKLNPVEKYNAYAFTEKLDIFAAKELKRFEEGWAPAEFEEKLRVNIMGFNIHAKPDRIDRKGDSYDIIDYKFKSNLRTLKKLDENTGDIQMPMYALLLERTGHRPPNDVWWYDMKNKFSLVKAFEQDIYDRFRSFLEGILGLLADENLTFDRTEKQARCSYCEYQIICGREG